MVSKRVSSSHSYVHIQDIRSIKQDICDFSMHLKIGLTSLLSILDLTVSTETRRRLNLVMDSADKERSGADLVFRDISVKLGPKQILQNVSGLVHQGTMLAIMGSSGEYT